jgi:hypothetical protein
LLLAAEVVVELKLVEVELVVIELLLDVVQFQI